ncbi:MAG: zinc dependent phospholipase C family protein, partial [Chloroflexota bacterium]
MPNFSAHLGIAKDAASRLHHPTVDRCLGAFLLGSVSPDIRIITRGKRDDTHFTHLDFQRQGESLKCLFQLHPDLAQAAGLTEPTRAFIVGYASHHFADELWILEMYRPFFGNRNMISSLLASVSS